MERSIASPKHSFYSASITGQSKAKQNKTKPKKWSYFLKNITVFVGREGRHHER